MSLWILIPVAVLSFLALIVGIVGLIRSTSRRKGLFAIPLILGIAGLIWLGIAFFGNSGLAPVTENGPVPTASATKVAVDTSNSNGIIARVQAEGWPIENGNNAAVVVTAPKGKYLLVNYGVEAREPKSGKEVPACGAALVYPGETVTITFWDGNAETLDGGETDSVAYAQSVLAARMLKDKSCKLWVDPIGFSLP